MKHFSPLLKTILIASAFIYASHTKAQTDPELSCGQYALTQSLYDTHPGLQQQVLSRQSTTGPASSKKTTSTHIVIPVVVHVLHQYGYENISDAAIRASIDRLNTDYLMQNSDTTQVVPEFQSIRARANIEFRLAKLDPNGNCTNGITRTVTSLTALADDNAKIIQWDPHRYFNIWVVKSLNTAGIAAYAYSPAIAAQMPNYDGMMVLAAYMDGISIGAFRRTVDHEVGHWLNLQDIWGTGPLGTACGDDGLSDTPITKGFTSCLYTASTTICTPGVVENRQNYMDQAYCSVMFTQDQVQLIQSTMSSTLAGRSSLCATANLLATGTDDIAYASTTPCAPKADFTANQNYACAGQSVTFTDRSFNATATAWQWTFTGAVPSTATGSVVSNVVYNTPGVYPVKLRAQNASGADSVTKTGYIIVRSTPGSATLPFAEGFETVSFPSNTWLINQGLDNPTWEITNTGATGSKSVRIQNINATKNDEDRLVSPVYHRSSTASISLNFKTAYAMQHASDNDLLRVMFSGDCGGTTYTVQTYSVGALGFSTNLVTAPYTPASGEWVQHTLPLGMPPGITDFVLVFSFTNGGGNNIYLDDINISQVVSVEELNTADLSLQVMPNPFGDVTTLHLDAHSSSPLRVELCDVTGKMVHSEETQLQAGPNTYTLQRNGLAPGLYFLNLYTSSGKLSHKLIIQ